MPVYVYSCKKCKETFETIQRITEPVLRYHYEAQTLETEKDNVIEFKGERVRMCDGDILRVIQPCNIIFKGSGWTPTYFSKGGERIRKADQALRKMGVEDVSGGWAKASDKDLAHSKKKRKGKKAKYLGQLRLD